MKELLSDLEVLCDEQLLVIMITRVPRSSYSDWHLQILDGREEHESDVIYETDINHYELYDKLYQAYKAVIRYESEK